MSFGLPFPKQQNFYSSKLKEFADDNFKFDENGRNLSTPIENIGGKRRNCSYWAIGEIAHTEQFLLFPQYFQKTCTADSYKPGFVWERVELTADHFNPYSAESKSSTSNPFPHNDTFWCPWETSLLKALWEKEKLLVTSNFSFSHSVFYLFG